MADHEEGSAKAAEPETPAPTGVEEATGALVEPPRTETVEVEASWSVADIAKAFERQTAEFSVRAGSFEFVFKLPGDARSMRLSLQAAGEFGAKVAGSGADARKRRAMSLHPSVLPHVPDTLDAQEAMLVYMVNAWSVRVKRTTIKVVAATDDEPARTQTRVEVKEGRIPMADAFDLLSAPLLWEAITEGLEERRSFSRHERDLDEIDAEKKA